MRRLVLGLVLAGFLVLPSLVITEQAAATVPGENGRLVYVEHGPTWIPGFTAGEIFTMNPDGSDIQRLTHDAGRASDGTLSMNFAPKWSPDGLFIAYVYFTELGDYSVRLMDSEGTFIRTITDSFAPISSVAWSPDGSYLAVNGTHTADGIAGIWIISEAGDSPRLLVPDGTITSNMYLVGNQDWSPDGRSIAFSANTSPGSSQVIVTDADMTSFTGPYSGDNYASGPRWDPSGDRLVYSVYSEESAGGVDIWETPYPSGQTTPLISGPGSQHTPTISPDGSQVYYISAEDHGLWSQTDGRVANFSGTSLDWQPIQRIAQSVGLVDPVTGKWYLTSLHGMVYSFYYGNPGDYPIMGDWDCTGTDTPGLYRQSDGYVYLRNSNSQGIADIRFYFGNPGDIPIAGDFNGDGCDTVSIYRQSEGRVYIINELGENDGGLGAADYSYYFGNPGDKPFVGDFNGDGTSTVGLHRESTGFVYFRNSNTQGNAEVAFFFGDPGDRLIASDWSYDGMDSPAVYRPSDRTFYLRYMNTQGNADEEFTWGQSRWLPVTGYFGPP